MDTEDQTRTMLEVQGLTRRYGATTAVDALNFRIAPREIVGLLGHNGAGKTTIMKMLTGYLEPTAGRILVDGLEMGVDTAAIQRRIGYLPENCPVWPDMTVVEFLEYQADLHDVPAAQRSHAVAVAIRRTELTDQAAKNIQTLSRGYRQRVGVAQAILHRPSIVILDEPTNGLDPTQIRHMRTLIRELAETATVILSTHILQEVQAVCSRVLILRSGRLVVDSHLDELQRGSRLLLTLDRDERTVAPILSAVEGVQALTLLGTRAGRYDYALQAPESAAPRVSAAVQAAGLALYALAHEQPTLEAVFAKVNDAATPEPIHAA
jgi:ABC-2 type transport system ATP-binding protein